VREGLRRRRREEGVAAGSGGGGEQAYTYVCDYVQRNRRKGRSLAAGRPRLPQSLLLEDDEDGDFNRAESGLQMLTFL
jgi:hypothetical protein